LKKTKAFSHFCERIFSIHCDRSPYNGSRRQVTPLCRTNDLLRRSVVSILDAGPKALFMKGGPFA
jgi:hypothetical protein